MPLGMLVDGKWTTEWKEQDQQGKFNRMPTRFRNRIKKDGSSAFQPESNRYHLYVSLACPWAHRTLMMRSLKGLQEVITISIVDPEMGEDGWKFSEEPGCIPDTVNHCNYLRELYVKANAEYTGRVTVPVLWDQQNQQIVNNESREIIRMLDKEFEDYSKSGLNLCPDQLKEKIEETLDAIYNPINNGVYRSGFASTQTAYEEAVTELFEHLDRWEQVLENQRYLCGNKLTEADICMFTTLLRFDAVYHGHFKCNLRRIVDYPNLWNYVKDIYQTPGVKETCNLDHIKRHYYKSHTQINPTRVVPKGPIINFDEPHHRKKLSQ